MLTLCTTSNKMLERAVTVTGIFMKKYLQRSTRNLQLFPPSCFPILYNSYFLLFPSTSSNEPMLFYIPFFISLITHTYHVTILLYIKAYKIENIICHLHLLQFRPKSSSGRQKNKITYFPLQDFLKHILKYTKFAYTHF